MNDPNEIFEELEAKTGIDYREVVDTMKAVGDIVFSVYDGDFKFSMGKPRSYVVVIDCMYKLKDSLRGRLSTSMFEGIFALLYKPTHFVDIGSFSSEYVNYEDVVHVYIEVDLNQYSVR